MKNLYLTTTIPYVNSDPHIGFALEIVQADALARLWRLLGHEVFFSSGTDEHGQKIFEKAKEKGEEVQAYVDHYAGQFENLKNALNLSYDAFIRTTSEQHKKAAQELWRRCALKGDIEKRKYKGLYCVGDEMFLKESDLVDGKCPNHPSMDPIEIEEENYFFKLSNYQEKILAYLKNPEVVLPDWRREEAIAFVEGGLEDFSISREKSRMSWGIPVPEDDTQVMYVWFDALTNYISTLGWPDDQEGNFKKFWEDGETLQMAGKDQVRFQSIMWQGMLMSADVKLTDKVLYHGFITSGGQKMSKSIGNVISPFDMVERYGTDAARYILLRHIHPFEDTDVTWERMDEWYNAHLANGLGNLTRRILTLSRKEKVNLETHQKKSFQDLINGSDTCYQSYRQNLENHRFDFALDRMWGREKADIGSAIGWLDQYIQQEKPFELVKTDPQKAKDVIRNTLRDLWEIATLIEFVMPETSKVIRDAIENEEKEIPMLFARKE